MHDIRLKVEGHIIAVESVGGTLVAGTAEHWALAVSFDDEWDALAKRVTVTCGAKTVGPLDYSDGMAVPWEAFVPGSMRFSFTGVDASGHEVVRTAYMREGIVVRPSGADMDDAQRAATEDVIHAARREIDELATAADGAAEAVASASKAAKRAEDAADKASNVAAVVQAKLDGGELVGPQGPRGERGETGARGPQGEMGEQGIAGATGPKGDTGPTGPTGPQGPKGPKGDKGEPGQDADIAGAAKATQEATNAAAFAREAGEAVAGQVIDIRRCGVGLTFEKGTAGRFVKPDGTWGFIDPEVAPGFGHSDPIRCVPGDTVYFDNSAAGRYNEHIALCAFSDSEDVESVHSLAVAKYTKVGVHEVTVPYGARWMVVNRNVGTSGIELPLDVYMGDGYLADAAAHARIDASDALSDASSAVKMADLAVSLFGTEELRTVEKAPNYETYAHSTFSGWVTQFSLQRDVTFTGFRVYMKARDADITEVTGYFGRGEIGGCATELRQAVACDIKAGTVGHVDFSFFGSVKAGEAFCLGAAANQLASFGFVGNSGTQFVTRYATNGDMPVDIGSFYDGTSERVAASLLVPVSGGGSGAKAVGISLPDRYDLVVGDTFELFWKGVVQAVDPYAYSIRAECEVGSCWRRKYDYRPEEPGTHALRVALEDDSGTELASKTVELVVSAAATSPETVKNVLCVGDSLLSNGRWAQESFRRLTGSGGSPAGLGLSNVRYIGTHSAGGAGYEGNGGWTFASYNGESKSDAFVWVTCEHAKTEADQHSLYTCGGSTWKAETIEAGRIKMIRTSGSGKMPQAGTLAHLSGGSDTSDIAFTASELAAGNPFWDESAGRVDFARYAESLGASGIDYCYVLLGWNSTHLSAGSYRSQVEEFISNLSSAYPACQICLLGLQVPSLDGFGRNYGCGWNYLDKLRKVFEFNDLYADIAKSHGNVHFVNVAGQFDTENSMPESTRPVNARSDKTEAYQTNGVHPSDDGYDQIADAVFRDLNRMLQA